MTGMAPNPAADRLKNYMSSPAISLSRVLLCLALAGCSAKDETVAPSQSQGTDFAFPLDAGTTWRYRYYYRSSQSVGSARVDQITGTQLWKSTGGGIGNSIRINVTRIDTTRLWWGGTDTTTQISVTDTSFLVEISPDSFFVHWYSLTHFPLLTLLGKIPRKIGFNTETFTIVSGSSDNLIIATMLPGKGSRHMCILTRATTTGMNS
jgi:hypothetical protein